MGLVEGVVMAHNAPRTRGEAVRLVCVVLCGCLASSCSRAPAPPPSPSPSGASGAPVDSRNGLEGGDRARFYHLAEGSEVYPVAWLQTLKNTKTGRPFISDLSQYGLLPDHDRGVNNPDGLPVGLTAETTRDLRFAGIRMVGVNCAACHVNELHHQGKAVARIDGAPNLFDLSRFFGDLAACTLDTIKSLPELWAFLGRLGAKPEVMSRIRQEYPAAPRVLEAYSDFQAMRAGDDRDVATAFEAAHQEEMARPAADLWSGFARVEGETERKTTVSPAQFSKEVDTILGRAGGRGRILAEDPLTDRKAALGEALAYFVETMRLLKARASFLRHLAFPKEVSARPTPPGFGRVDAFGGARNLLFPDDAQPLTAPIGYPYLWNVERVSWYHWDGSTTSILERNVGQALGLGAVFDRATLSSTVLVQNLQQLESLAARITPPTWPTSGFGPIDAAKTARGMAIHRERCAGCHSLPSSPDERFPDRLYAPAEVGTDKERAERFATPVGATPFHEAISPILKGIIQRAGGTSSTRLEWRTTRKYVARPLVAVWATAPYLHNGSVPTLHDLLLPEESRPARFGLCSREYDPVKLGFVTTSGDATCTFDASLVGNANKGHSGPPYGTDLTEAQRSDLLEYLKTGGE